MALALDSLEKPLVLIRQSEVSTRLIAQTAAEQPTMRTSSGVQPLRSIAGFKASFHRFAHSGAVENPRSGQLLEWGNAGGNCHLRPLFRVPTRLATAAHFVPSSSTALKRRSSSSALQEPFDTRVAICAHHRLRQSLLVRPGSNAAIPFQLLTLPSLSTMKDVSMARDERGCSCREAPGDIGNRTLTLCLPS